MINSDRCYIFGQGCLDFPDERAEFLYIMCRYSNFEGILIGDTGFNEVESYTLADICSEDVQDGELQQLNHEG